MTNREVSAAPPNADPAALAAMAQGLLESMTGVVAAAHTLRRVGPHDGVTAEWLLDVLVDRSEQIVAALQDLLRGVPPGVVWQAVDSN